MHKKSLVKSVFTSLVLAVVLAPAASADSIRLPVKLVCTYAYADGAKQTDVLYTRLGDVRDSAQLPVASDDTSDLTVWSSDDQGSEPRRDEVAFGWRGDYYRASIDATTYRYDLWTCDTEDRFYSFATADLLASATDSVALRNKTVKGKLVIAVREDEESFDLTCTAKY